MSATYFVGGSELDATFVNTLYYNGGHVHDGTDADGHAQKIDLYRDTTGILNLDASATGTLDLYSIGYRSGSFDASLINDGGIEMTINYSYFVGTDIVKLWWDGTTGLTSQANHVAAASTMPVAITPSQNRICAVIENGNASALGDMRALSSGGMSWNYLAVSTDICGQVVEYAL